MRQTVSAISCTKDLNALGAILRLDHRDDIVTLKRPPYGTMGAQARRTQNANYSLRAVAR